MVLLLLLSPLSCVLPRRQRLAIGEVSSWAQKKADQVSREKISDADQKQFGNGSREIFFPTRDT
jgi:hypothetical protein